MGVTGQVIEQVGGVRADLIVAGEETQVGIETRRAGIVVAGGEMAVAADGVAFAPQSVLFSEQLKRVLVTGLDLRRTVSLYGVAGRQRMPVANMIVKMLRAANWSRYAS